MNIKNYIKNRLRYILREKYPSIYRPDSKPYISGDTLRKFSDHIFDETTSIIPENIPYFSHFDSCDMLPDEQTSHCQKNFDE